MSIPPRPRRSRPKKHPRPDPRRGLSRLRFRRDGTFTIVQLTDLHWSNGEGPDHRTGRLIDEVLTAERPDLVVLTGDVVSGAEAKDPSRAWHEVAAVVEAHGRPWAAVFGNHDDEGSASRAQMMKAQRAHALCLSERGPRGLTGVGNYVLSVQGSRGRGRAAFLYFLDSGAYSNLGVGHYAWIARDQIAWYLKTAARHAREHRGPEPLPALAFIHIPLPEWDEMWRTQECRGHRHEPVCSPALNSGFFAALREAGDVMGVFCGHDHVNDFEGELHGIRLCYGRATGFGEYGRDGFPRGARVLRLHEGERRFETWVRVEGGRMAKAPVHKPDAPGA